MKWSSKKLAIWVLGAAMALCMHASYVNGKKGSAFQISSHLEPTDAMDVYATLNEEELEMLRDLYENFSGSMEYVAVDMKEAPLGLKPENPSTTKRAETKDQRYNPIIIEVAGRHEVDPALIKAIIMAESGYNPKAVSKRGAKGLMQLMPVTAKSLGVKDIFDPEHNISAGVGYFKKMLTLFDGDVKLALAAYNAGSKKVRKYKGIPPFRATKIYIKKVFKYYELFKEQM